MTSKTTGTAKANKEETGIKWITEEPAEITAFVSIDRQERLYLNTATRRAIGNKTNAYYVGVDEDGKTLFVMPAGKTAIKGLKPFRLDSRNYAKASVLVKTLELKEEQLPVRYEFSGTRSTPHGTAYEFTIEN